eukprot:CAMPEP_0183737160 /NCGR_PEP_ID=MMETSP0737-20130205/51173_1 /TAXON_ID=385413 /ORGANISM="Thalassiosira miniscula, Strain CCMP1093" /LENGTH=385 /DNA_ID=CAMNT_0025971373 /DNA_START=143 /DNA_END=1300 /DNA_ORIENTATION=-
MPAPNWWIQPTKCEIEALECARQGKRWGAGAEANLGDHICALDSCYSAAFDSTWSALQGHWNQALNLVNRIPGDTIILLIGDSTMGQQLRALNCMMEEAAGPGSHIVSTVIQVGLENFNDTINKLDEARASVFRKICIPGMCYLHWNSVLGYRLVTFIWSAKGLYAHGETAVKDMIIQSSEARGPYVDRFHLNVVVGQGAWINCNSEGCGDWHINLRRFQNWWRNAKRDNSISNATLIIRDALPQHFATPDGRYTSDEKKSQCEAIKDRVTSGKQAIKIRSDENCSLAGPIVQEDWSVGLRRLPVWGLAVGQAHLHSNRPVTDCTHYCLPTYTLWNIMLVHIIIDQTTSLKEANKNGGLFASLLISMSTEEARLDLLAANADICR